MNDGIGARSIPEFCEAHGFSRASFYNHRDEMPATIRVGNRRLVTMEAEQRWRREREQAERRRKQKSA
jgi:hypothetical protein